MSGIVEKLIKPTVEILEHIGRKIPEALGRGHLRMSKMAHDAADHFDKAEQDLAQDAERDLKGLGGHGGHLPGEGGGTGARAVEGAAARDGEKAAGEAAAKDAGESLRPQDPAKASVPGGERQCKTDPVDVATGEMMLAQVDVRLAAALPLVAERTYLSSYRHGVWFGPSWASVLDQRLELDPGGVVFASADGMRLEYPPPRAQAAVFPRRGPRLALTWGGSHRDPMRIADDKTGQTLVFDHPRPAPGAVGGVLLRLVAIEDRCGRRIDITWSEDDTPALLSHHGGYRVAVDRHPELPRITAFRLLDAEGPGSDATLARFGYDEAGNLSEVYNSSGLPFRFTYDAQHRITGWIDRNGTEYAYEYDEADRVVRTTGSDGILSSSFAYDDQSRTTTFTDSLGQVTRYEHNEGFRLVRITDPLGNVTVQEWDENNRLLRAVIDPLGDVVRYEYDAADNVTGVVRPDGSAARIVYNGLSLPVEVSEPDGLTWRHTYDGRGNRLSTVYPAGGTTVYMYDDAGDLIALTDALGNTQRAGYNAVGLVVQWVDALGNTTTAERDAFGRVSALTAPMGQVTRFGWNAEGQPAWCQYPDGSQESWDWDAEGNLLSHTGTAGHTTTTAYGHFDLPAQRTTAEGLTYRFAYDTELRLTEVTGPTGLHWRYRYDAAGRLVAETDFNGRTQTYGHDAAGRLVRRTNGAGQSVTLVRNNLGMVIEQHAGEGVTRFERDPAGRLLRAAGGHTQLERRYDAAKRLIAESVGGRTTTWSYDLLGRCIERRTPTGIVSSWSYDAQGAPQALRFGDDTLRFVFDANGRETARVLGGDLVLTQSWDACDRLTAQSVGRPGGDGSAALQHRSYAYRADGVLTEAADLLTGTRRYALDARGRIQAVQARGWSESYAYDSMGNLTQAATPLPDESGPEREYTGTLLRRSGRTAFEYDGQGRIVRATTRLLSGRQRTQTFIWNAEDQLTQTITPDGVCWQYRYDPVGRRIAKQQLGQDGTVTAEVRFTWDGARLVEQSGPGGRSTTWDHLPDSYTPIAQIDHTGTGGPSSGPSAAAGGGRQMSQAEVDRRFHAIITDLTGAPSELVSPAGELAWLRRATAWGVTATDRPDGTIDCPLRFPGQYEDAETGWYFNVLRHYDPHAARYTGPDPLGLLPAPNHYAYVPNPFQASDPLGLAPDCGIDQYAWDGSVKYGKLDHLGRPTGISASIRPEMLDKGSEAGKITPPGWRGDGTKFNEARGHLLAARLGGIGKGRMARHNLVTLTQDPVNTPRMRDDFEQKVYDAVDKGEVVQYSVKPIYEGTNPIPIRLEFEAHGNKGFKLTGKLDNPAAGVRTAIPGR